MRDDDDFEIETPVLADDDQLRAFVPTAFGKQSKGIDIEAQIARTRRPAWATAREAKAQDGHGGSDSNSDSDSSDDDDDDQNELDRYPLSHELVLKTHEKAVTTVSLDPGGGRMATGSRDGTVKLYDFAAMTPTTLRAFKSVDPWQLKKSTGVSGNESHPVQHVAFHPQSAGVLLCVTAQPQAHVLTRDGGLLTEFVKGDMYLRDMHHTKGHVGEISMGAWHPTDATTCVTAGADSTLRIWDVNNKRSQKEVLVFKSRAAGAAGRTRMTAVAWSAGAATATAASSTLVATAFDGSLVVYSGNDNGPFTRPAAEVRSAHQPGTWTSGVDVSSDGRMVVTRGGDDSIKLWDLRKMKQALVTVAHETGGGGSGQAAGSSSAGAARFPMANICYGPNAACILTGSAAGNLHILNPGNLQPEVVTPVTPGSALVAVMWHPRLNQVIAGSANGETHVLFDPVRSSRGAADIVRRAPKTRHIDDDASLTMDQTVAISGDSIVVPGAQGRRTNKGGGMLDPRRPHMPLATPFARTNPDDKHIAENIPLSRMLHEDPREALLKYAEIADKDPIFTGAYKHTAPVTEYAALSDDDEDAPDKKKVKR